MKYLFLFLFLIPFILHSQDFEFDTYSSDNYTYEIQQYQNIILENGSTYKITLEGTFAPWEMNAWTSPCGEYEQKPYAPFP